MAANKKPAQRRRKSAKKEEEGEVAVVETAVPVFNFTKRKKADHERNVVGVVVDPGGENWGALDEAGQKAEIRPRIVSSLSEEMVQFRATANQRQLEMSNTGGLVPRLSFNELPLDPEPECAGSRRAADLEVALECLRGKGQGAIRWGDEEEHQIFLAEASTQETRAAFRALVEWAPEATWIVEDLLVMATMLGRPHPDDGLVLELKKKGLAYGLRHRLDRLAAEEKAATSEARAFAGAKLEQTLGALNELMKEVQKEEETPLDEAETSFPSTEAAQKDEGAQKGGGSSGEGSRQTATSPKRHPRKR